MTPEQNFHPIQLLSLSLSLCPSPHPSLSFQNLLFQGARVAGDNVDSREIFMFSPVITHLYSQHQVSDLGTELLNMPLAEAWGKEEGEGEPALCFHLSV